MAAFEIVWTELAELKFHNLLTYYLDRNRSNVYPLRLQDATDNVLEILQTNPFIGRVVHASGTRAVPVLKFEIIYEVVDNDIVILTFWDPKQDPKRLWDIL